MKDGQPSQTALRIAQLLIHFDGRPGLRDLTPPGAADATRAALEGAGLIGARDLRRYRARWFAAAVWAASWLLGGGAIAHYPLRKRFCEDQVLAAIGAGASQLLVIGAGFDTLAPRLARRRPELLAVEVDHPSTAAAKARGLAAAGLAAPNLSLVAADLGAQPLAEALAGAPWRVAPSAIVVEGLLMYLSPGAVRGLLAALRAQVAPGSRLVFTWVPAAGGQDQLSGPMRALIRAFGEPITFSAEPDALEALLEATGWRLLPRIDLRARYLTGALEGARTNDMERFSVAEAV